MPDKRRLRPAAGLGAAALVCAAVSVLPATPAFATTSTITLDNGTTYQTVDGFGTALVDQTGAVPANPLDLMHMGATQQQQILDALFSQSTGAGLSIMRFELGSGSFYGAPGYTIEPTSPGSPSATPTYQWDHSADDQVYLAQQAQSRGVNTFYADAWSAPGFMKTNGSATGGGTLCGESSCASGDWRQAYANYLVQYLEDYAAEGITPTYVDATNEPSYAAGYQSMASTPAQSTDFLKVLGPTIAASGLSTKIACCDDISLSNASSSQASILADPTAAGYESIAASHGYGGNVTAIPAATAAGKDTWESEYSCVGDTWNTAYSTGDCSGQYWADGLYTSMSGGVSAYLAWTGDWDHTDNEDLIRNINSTTYQVSSRLWAMANYSRYVRPGAVRISAQSSDSNMLTTAYRNTDGSFVIVIDNHNTAAQTATIAGPSGGTATPYVTDDSGGMQQQSAISIGSGFSYSVPPNSTVTLRLQGTTVSSSGGGGSQLYKIVGTTSGLDLSIPGASTATGTHADQETDAGLPAQKWTMVPLGGGQYEIVNLNSGLALSVDNSSTTAGANINQWTWLNVPAQKWTITPLSGGSSEIVNVNSGMALSITGNTTTPGSLADQWSWINATSQAWTLQPTS